MSQRIREWRRRLVAVACGVFACAVLALVSSAPVLAETFHGGAHGRANVMVQARHIVPLTATDLTAIGVAAAVACIAVVIGRRLTVRKPSQISLHSARTDQATTRRRAA